MEVSGAPRGDQESLKEVFKSSKVTIHGVCQVIMSPQGAVGWPQRAPKELLESQNEGQNSQKSATEPFEKSENDLEITNMNVHKTIEKSMKIIDF